MLLQLQYGREGLEVRLDAATVDVLEPRFVPGLADPRRAFGEALASPLDATRPRELVSRGERVAVVIPDITRPFPAAQILPWLLEALPDTTCGDVTVLVGTGSHRACTDEELDALVGAALRRDVLVVNHDAYDPAANIEVGRATDGSPIRLNRRYVEADRRIIMGFVEPHFFAGFSGGYKAVFPGIADIDTIQHYHRAEAIGDARSTWGVLEGNPTQEQIRHGGSRVPVDLCVNVTLNRDGALTGIFCGSVDAAHAAGCAAVFETSMVGCARRYPVVVTTNGGWPLDQNLYQSVKGMSAAAQIVAPGGLIVTAAECADGFPAHGNFRRLLADYATPGALLEAMRDPSFGVHDQWQAQKLALIRQQARVALFSAIPARDVPRGWFEPVEDVAATVAAALHELDDAAVAVLPEGPMTIPYVTS